MLLEKINSSQDLKKLTIEQLPQVAQELRSRMIEVVSQNGGHIASSLGAVELILALHYCLDTPRDKIVFDVGHQAYAHKIITGRNKSFSTMRQLGGISGFPCVDESAFDVFTSGHSSDAVSLALGLATARDYLPLLERFRVVAVIGDGSLSGGLCFEGLNNSGHLKKDMLVILNTNEHSIAPNVGAISTYLNKIISLPVYNRFRDSLENFIKFRLPKGSRILKLVNKFEKELKNLFVPGVLFEELGFRYFGPYDGHNLPLLITTLKNIVGFKGPLLLHVVTKKGKGYSPAEVEPVKFHGTGPFDLKSGKTIIKNDALTYTQLFSEILCSRAANDPRIIAVTAAMPEGTGLDKFRDSYPGRFFDVGIAEPHAVCFAAGLAKAGLRPVVAVYSTFLQRAYDQIIEAVALQKLPVIFMIDRAGIVGEDGYTHQGIFDLVFLRNIPNMNVLAPADAQEFIHSFDFAISLNAPVAIRYPKDFAPSLNLPENKFELGKPQMLRSGNDAIIIALGSMVMPCLEAAEMLKQSGYSVGVINARFASPLDYPAFKQMVSAYRYVFTIEEGLLEGGFGCALSSILPGGSIIPLGLPREFITHGKRSLLLERYGLNKDGIARRIKEVLKK